MADKTKGFEGGFYAGRGQTGQKNGKARLKQ